MSSKAKFKCYGDLAGNSHSFAIESTDDNRVSLELTSPCGTMTICARLTPAQVRDLVPGLMDCADAIDGGAA